MQMRRHRVAILGLLFNWGLTLWAYFQLPERVPVHWNFSGEVDRWGSRAEFLAMPAIASALFLFMVFWPKIDPQKRGEWKSWPLMVAATTWGLFFVQAGILYALFATLNRSAFSPLKGVVVALGLLFLILGNYLPKVPQNWIFGVRTPWTLASRAAWQKTHRLAGWLFVGVGGVTLALAFVAPPSTALGASIGLELLATVWVVYVSYRVWRQERDRHDVSS